MGDLDVIVDDDLEEVESIKIEIQRNDPGRELEKILLESISLIVNSKKEIEPEEIEDELVGEEVEEDFSDEDREKVIISIKYGRMSSLYQAKEEEMYRFAETVYGSPSSISIIDNDNLFSYTGKLGVSQKEPSKKNLGGAVVGYNSEKQQFGQLQGKDARSIVDRLFLQKLGGAETSITPEERAKFKFWKWFNPAERRLYEQQSPFHQSPYWQLAPILT